MAQSIKIKHSYDEEADVLYINFSTDDEPAFTENIDDFMMLEIGWFTGLPKGLRIIGPKAHDMQHLNLKMVFKQVGNKFKSIMEERAKQIKSQEPIIQNWLGAELPRTFASMVR